MAVNMGFSYASVGGVMLTLPLSFVRISPPHLYCRWDSLHIPAGGFQSSLTSSNTPSANISPKGWFTVSRASLNQLAAGLYNSHKQASNEFADCCPHRQHSPREEGPYLSDSGGQPGCRKRNVEPVIVRISRALTHGVSGEL